MCKIEQYCDQIKAVQELRESLHQAYVSKFTERTLELKHKIIVPTKFNQTASKPEQSRNISRREDWVQFQ